MRGFHEPFQLLDTDDLSILTNAQYALILEASLGNSYAGLAAHYGVSVGTIKSRLSRARAKIVKRRPVLTSPNFGHDHLA